MEPLPETERLEEFKPLPAPSLRISAATAGPTLPGSSTLECEPLRKPPNIRRSTDPNPRSPSSHVWSSSFSIPYRPRTASPLSGGHTRSRSAASLAPSMSRTHSSPGVSGSAPLLHSPLLRPSSPSGFSSSSPSRVRPLRKAVDEAFPPQSPVRTSVLELDQLQSRRSVSPSFGLPPQAQTLGRVRRTSSPMRSIPPVSSTTGGALTMLPSTPSSASSSSSSYRAYDAYYTNHYGGSLSSIPSTPTSARSRSPSISSLETIPDSPDAEEAALEAERVSTSEAGADSLQVADSKARVTLDTPARGRSLAYGSNRDKRKRWSVCGAERRGDLDLETIWED